MNKTILRFVTFKNVSANKQNAFEDIPELNGKKISAIQVFTIDSLSNAPSGATMISDGDALECGITLLDKENNKILDQMPLYNLQREKNSGFLLKFSTPVEIAWTQSYVQTFDASTGISANEVVGILIYY